MKPLIVCVSIHHGNTLKIAEAMAEVLEAEILSPRQVLAKRLSDYDLIGLGSGIYFGKHHRSLLELAEKLPRSGKIRVFIFSTSGIPEIPIIHNYHKPLRKILAEKGLRIVGEFSCRGFTDHWPLNLIGGINHGRPNEVDLDKAREFAGRLLTSSSSQFI